jgi:glycosyltransferase involved in cell wall biosynthesis
VGGDWSRAAEVKEAVNLSPYRADVVFTGFVPRKELPVLYRGADLFIFPSLYEGFGLPVLEAMACGTPVACSKVSSLPEVGGDAVEYFNPQDPSDMAGALERVFCEPEYRERLKILGLKRSARFSWKQTADRTLEILEIVGASRRIRTARDDLLFR